MSKEKTLAVLEIRYPQQASYHPVELKELMYVQIGTVISLSTLVGAISEMGMVNEPISGFSRLPYKPKTTQYNAETAEAASALIIKHARETNLNVVIIPPPETESSRGTGSGYYTLGILTSVPLNGAPHVFLVDGKTRDLSKIIRISNREQTSMPVSGKKKRKRGACFIATACYGSYDCRQVMILRNYRDEVLRKSRSGRYLIYLYYRVSPTVANWLARSPEPVRRTVRRGLDIIVVLLRRDA